MSSRSPRKLDSQTMSEMALDWPNMISRIPDAVRQIPARTKVTPGTVLKWLQGSTKPSGDNVAILLEEFDEFADALMERTKRKTNPLSQVATRKLLDVLKEME